MINFGEYRHARSFNHDGQTIDAFLKKQTGFYARQDRRLSTQSFYKRQAAVNGVTRFWTIKHPAS